MATIGFIGAGNMAEALINGIVKAKLFAADNILASDIRAERLDELAKKFKIKTTGDNAGLVGQSDIIMLCVKPQTMDTALSHIAGCCKLKHTVVSIAAGVKIKKISAMLGDIPVIRVMPNTPALIGQGASVLYANKKAENKLTEVKKIFDAVGLTFVVHDEKLMDAITAVSGSGPAYYFLMMEERTKAAVELGLPADMASELVIRTAKGAAMLAEDQAKDKITPAELRRRVTSPGGTTEAAIKIFLKKDFGSTILQAMKCAAKRSEELG